MCNCKTICAFVHFVTKKVNCYFHFCSIFGSCWSILTQGYISNQKGTFSSAWVTEKVMESTANVTNSTLVFLKIQVLTDVSMAHLRMTWHKVTNTITFSQYEQFVVCHSLEACQLNWCQVVLAADEDFACTNSYLKILYVTSVQCVSFKIWQIITKISATSFSGAVFWATRYIVH